MLELVFQDRTGKNVFTEAFVQRVCDAAEPYLRIPQDHTAEVGIALIDEEAMRDLNAKRRNVDTSTDVLSFPLHMEPITGYTAILLGDCFICPAVVSAKAQESGVPFEQQMQWTIVHGLLHLAGYDHEEMEAPEQEILNKLKS